MSAPHLARHLSGCRFAPLPVLFTAARPAGRGNFSVFCINVAGVDIAYFDETEIRRFVE
jgi:hypothetical protein